MTLPRAIDKRHLNLRAADPFENAGLNARNGGFKPANPLAVKQAPLNVVWCESLFTHRHSLAKHTKNRRIAAGHKSNLL
jgi:hypothetical protein